MHHVLNAPWSSAASFIAGFLGSALLAVLWNVLGFGVGESHSGYALTQYLTPHSWPFVLAYALVALLLGWATQTAWPVAVGMIFTLPLACGIELARDASSHNLIPFEILLTWAPGFAIALGGAFYGRSLRE